MIIKKSFEKEISIMFVGDIHWGSPECDVNLLKENLKYCVDNEIFVITTGDLLECGTRYSVGSSVYTQLNPQKQLDDIYTLLLPLKEKGLLLNIMSGNHESRVVKETGIDVSKSLSDRLGVEYSGDSCWFDIKCGKVKYLFYVTHGYGSASTITGKLNRIWKIAETFECDLLAMGHVHELSDFHKIKETVRYGHEIKKETMLLITGHYLCYDDRSYARTASMTIGKIGSPIIHLNDNEKKIIRIK